MTTDKSSEREALIKAMVDRFLGWKLPKSFGPDGGVSFERTVNGAPREHDSHWWPIGTNLFTATEARAMVEHMLGDVPSVDDFPPCGALHEARAALPQQSQEALDALRGLDSDTRVRFYEHDFYVLSNFSAFNLHWEGRTFPTSEHAYHWSKFDHDEEGVLADLPALRYSILTAPSAHEAFKLAEANKAHRRIDWDDIKGDVMLRILRAKAHQHEYVRRKLLATGDRELVEDSWRDDYWGWGPNRDGKNMLGRLWMRVRDELRAAIAKGERHE